MKINPLKLSPNRSLVAMALAVIAGLPVLGQSEQHSEGLHGHRSAYFKNGEIPSPCSVSPRASLSPPDIGISNLPGPRPGTSWFFSACPKSSSSRHVEDGDLHHQCRRYGFSSDHRCHANQLQPDLDPGRQKHSDLEPKEPEGGGYCVMVGKIGGKPGEEMALTNKGTHTWAYTCLTDGRILVNHAHPKQGRLLPHDSQTQGATGFREDQM